MSEQALTVVLQNPCGESALPDRSSFTDWVAAVFGAQRGGEITIRIVDTAESRALNSRYGGKDKPTNVLAFVPSSIELAALDGDTVALGDLAVCADVVRAEAQQRGLPLEAHWAHMVVHGCLHLTGWDHQSDAQARAMEAREAELLTALGYGNPYD